jgi:mRNA-degrading endonuclease RelE of RelBE toxin-antitoxin system
MYDLRILRRAERELVRLDPPTRDRIMDRLGWFAEHVREVEHESLKADLAAF